VDHEGSWRPYGSRRYLEGTDDVATLVFDEIDTGVGGRSGHVVAAMLHELAQGHQVIAITHLPQIAARADQHIKVVKTLAGERTAVAVVDLDARGRVQEVAEMLGGASPGEAAIRNAQELLSGSHSGSVAT
jgi:DNA repair protein RecN (Recombination protein N)